MKTAERIAVEVRALEHMDLRSVRADWRRRYGEPPKMRSIELLARLLAWRIQADAFGGLNAATTRMLSGKRLPPTRPSLETGSRLRREWGGRVHEVDVLGAGFRYNGRDYRSLSEIARAITGTRWNGPRFFGLRGHAR